MDAKDIDRSLRAIDKAGKAVTKDRSAAIAFLQRAGILDAKEKMSSHFTQDAKISNTRKSHTRVSRVR